MERRKDFVSDSNKWTCVCGKVNAGDFCEACGTSREEVVGKEGKTQVKENIVEENTGERDSKHKLSDYLSPSAQMEKQSSQYEKITRKNGSVKQISEMDRDIKENDTPLILDRELWDCSCGAMGNKGNFCSNCGRPKELANEPLHEENMDQTVQVGPIISTPKDHLESSPLESKKNETDISDGARSSKPKKRKWILVGIIGFFLCIFLGYMFALHEKEPVKNLTRTVASDLKKGDNTHSPREMKTDLSLGGLDLGMDIDGMHDVLGKENSSKDSQDSPGYMFYYYDDLQVGIKNRSVDALVSDGNSVKTKRGISEGSSLKDVQNAYGSDYTSMDYEDMTLYEYTFRDMKGRPGILRFAVKKKDNKVKYISVRIVEGGKKQSSNKNSVINGKLGQIVQGKDNVDARIIQTADKINQYLNTHSDFRNAGGLKQEARKEIQDAQSYIKALQNMTDVNTADRDMLIRLFQLETERAQGLYDGMAASSSGGSYQSGFERGRRASDEFDKQNADFKKRQ